MWASVRKMRLVRIRGAPIPAQVVALGPRAWNRRDGTGVFKPGFSRRIPCS